MSKELGYVLVTPYALRKSRTGGILARLLTITGLDLVASRMFGPSAELVKGYSELIKSELDVRLEIRELLSEYVLREFAPTKEGQVQRVLMFLFEGENAVLKLRDAIGGFEDSITCAGTIRDTYGDYITANDGSVAHFEPAVLVAPTLDIAKSTIQLWAQFSQKDGGVLDHALDLTNEKAVEKTLVIIKPDNFTFPNSRPGHIIDFFSRSGLRLMGTKLLRMSLAEAQNFYGPIQAVLRDSLSDGAVDRACAALKKEFGFEMNASVRAALEKTLGPSFGDNEFFNIIKFMTGQWAPDASEADRTAEGKVRCLTLVYAGENAVKKIRAILGPTDPSEAQLGSVRKEYGTNIMINAAHASDSPENALREIDILKIEADTIKETYDAHYH